MKRISLFLLTAVSLFAAAGDVIFRQNTGTTITDRTVTVPSPMSNQIFGLSADTERPARFTIGSGLTLSGTSPDFTITSTGLGGTVTSVGLTLPASVFSVTGSPVTSAGVLAGDFIPQPANMIFAGPTTGGADIPSFRSIVATDLPFNGLPYVAGNSITITGNVIDTIQDIRTTASVQFGNVTAGGPWAGDAGVATRGVLAQRSGDSAGFYAASFGPGESQFIGYHALGTAAAPTALTAASGIASFYGAAYNGSGWSYNTNIAFRAAENQTPTTAGSVIEFYNTLIGTNTGWKSGWFTSNGNLLVGTNTDVPGPGKIKAVGIEDTPIGATTPSTGNFTSVTASGLILSIKDGEVFQAGGGTDGTPKFFHITSPTAGNKYFGSEDSAGGTFGATPYSFLFYNDSSRNFEWLIDGVRKLQVTPTGINATAIGATTPSTGVFSALTLLNLAQNYPALHINGALGGALDFQKNGAVNGTIYAGNGLFTIDTVTTNPLFFAIAGVTKGQVTDTGFQGAIGATTPSTGAFTNLTSTGTTSFAAGNFTVPGGQVMSLNSSNATGIYTRLTVNGVSTGFWGSSDQVLSGSPSNLAWLNATTGASMELYADGFRATAINATAIGATTPSTGQFTNFGARRSLTTSVAEFFFENSGSPDLGNKVLLKLGPSSGFVGTSLHPYVGAVTEDAGSQNAGLVFGTYDNGTLAERMRIRFNGNVGIGTTNPYGKTHIYNAGTMRPSNATTNPIQTGLVIQSTANTVMTLGASEDAADSHAGWIQMRHNLEAGDVFPLSLQPNGGNVGIGTSAPGFKLDVEGTFRMRGTPTGGFLEFTAEGSNTYNTINSLNNARDAYIGLVLRTGNFTVTTASGQHTFISDAHYFGIPQDVYISRAGAGALWTNGRWGVGIAPDSALHVAGGGAGLRIGYNGTSVNYYDANGHQFRDGATSVDFFGISSNGIKTQSPSGATAQPWKLGDVSGGVARVEINGTPYNLMTTAASSGDKHYFFTNPYFIGNTAGAGGPDAIDLTTDIAAAGLSGFTVKGAMVRIDTRLGPLPAGGYTATATTWVWGNTAGLDYGISANVIANGGGAGYDSSGGICPIFSANTIYWRRDVQVNATGEEHKLILLGFVYQ